MAIVNQYRVWCNTDSKWVYCWDTTAPTVCPENSGHSIDTAKTTIIQTAGDPVCASDGKHVYIPDRFLEGLQTNWVGCDDDITNGTRFGGSMFKLSTSSAEEVTRECRFFEFVHLAGARAFCVTGAKADDWIRFLIYAPATAGTSNEGAGAYDKYAIGGGINMFIPNATTEGDWDLNLTEKYNANVDFTKVVPVPSADNTGYFDADPIANTITLNAGGNGNCNLFDSAINLSNKVYKHHIYDSVLMDFTDFAVQTKAFFPHWICKVFLNNSAASLITLVWDLYIARYDLT
jgi:hypothetical protein